MYVICDKNCYRLNISKINIILFDSSYCSKEHQKKGWKAGHKANCKAYKIEIGKYGRQLVASRDLKPGSRILTKNKPSAVGPRQKIDFWTCLIFGCTVPPLFNYLHT